jgi:hypothetical protein
MSTADQIAVIAAAISFGAALVSVLAIYLPWRNTHDSEIFKEAVAALERSYRALTNNGAVTAPPPSDRLNWLTAARHIEAFRELKSELKSRLYRRLCQEHEEHWRNQFYLCILRERIFQVSYFQQGPLEPRSLLVVFSFAAWPNDRTDPIDELDVEELFARSDLLRGNVGLRNYLSTFPEYGGEA